MDIEYFDIGEGECKTFFKLSKTMKYTINSPIFKAGASIKNVK